MQGFSESGELTIRDATERDLARIAEIQDVASEAARWSVADYLAHSCKVAEAGGMIAGFLVTRETAPGETEILNLAVDPAFKRKGIGKRLLFAALIGEVFLEVREGNAAALALYESVGFRMAGRRKAYYSDPYEDAIVMRFCS